MRQSSSTPEDPNRSDLKLAAAFSAQGEFDAGAEAAKMPVPYGDGGGCPKPVNGWSPDCTPNGEFAPYMDSVAGRQWGLRARQTEHQFSSADDERAARMIQAGQSTGAKGDVSKLRGKRILLVEDEPMLAMDVTMILADIGLKVIGPCATLKQGIASAEVELLDLAMLDINLRGEMSYPIADILARRGVPLIFATGYDTVAWGKPAPRIGKPYSQSDIETALLSVID